jgi:hypothetical protein
LFPAGVLHEYMLKGFAINDERLKHGTMFNKTYFKELLERIREIRLSERWLYLQITDIFALSSDYDKDSAITHEFFGFIQNKLHYAITDSEKKLFDIVIVWKLDRFSRDRYDSAHYKRLLGKNGAKVVSATEPISNDASGILLESMLEGMAEYYSAELSEKITRGRTAHGDRLQRSGTCLRLQNANAGFYF